MYRIGGKLGFGQCILEAHGLPCPQDIMKNRLSERSRGRNLVAQAYVDNIATSYGFRPDARLIIM